MSDDVMARLMAVKPMKSEERFVAWARAGRKPMTLWLPRYGSVLVVGFLAQLARREKTVISAEDYDKSLERHLEMMHQRRLPVTIARDRARKWRAMFEKTRDESLALITDMAAETSRVTQQLSDFEDAVSCCPHGDPLHFHGDGCPSCWAEDERKSKEGSGLPDPGALT